MDRLLRFLGFGFALFWAVPAKSPAATTMFLCNAAHTGVCPQSSLPAQPKVIWRYFTDRLNRSTPCYVSGVVYVGSNNGNLYALDANSGRAIWIYHAREPVSSSPAVSAGLVFFTDDRALYAVDRNSGKLRWSHTFGRDLPHPGHQWDFFESSPTLSAGRLFVGSGDGKLYAFVALSGKLMWSIATAGRVRSTPAAANGRVFVGSFDGNVYAVDALTGALQWRFKTAGNADFPLGEVQSSPSVATGLVFFGSRDGHVYAVDERRGTQRWSVDEHGSWVISSPAVAHGVVYYGSSDGNAVRAVDELTGKRKWSYDAGSRVWASPLLDGKYVYFATGGGEVLRLAASTGAPRGFADSEGTIYSSVTVAQGTLFYASDDGYVYAAR